MKKIRRGKRPINYASLDLLKQIESGNRANKFDEKKPVEQLSKKNNRRRRAERANRYERT